MQQIRERDTELRSRLLGLLRQPLESFLATAGSGAKGLQLDEEGRLATWPEGFDPAAAAPEVPCQPWPPRPISGPAAASGPTAAGRAAAAEVVRSLAESSTLDRVVTGETSKRSFGDLLQAFTRREGGYPAPSRTGEAGGNRRKTRHSPMRRKGPAPGAAKAPPKAIAAKLEGLDRAELLAMLPADVRAAQEQGALNLSEESMRAMLARSMARGGRPRVRATATPAPP